jgi:adenine-specific DNA-methyltransferase
MQKLDPRIDGATPDMVEQNLETLRQLFPDAFTESSDEHGPRWKVDFESLREILGDYIEDQQERYSFTWNGKSRARRIAQTPSTGTLRPCPEESVNWDTTQNLFIEGDNLEVLKLLQKSYHKRVKLIYIDPPYNTGNEFIYPDKFQDNLATYLRYTGQIDDEGFHISAKNTELSGRYHTNWLNMMLPRLKLARNLLRDDGVLFTSIDDHEVHNLRHLFDEVFGEENFLSCIAWKKRSSPDARSTIGSVHDWILCYVKNGEQPKNAVGKMPLNEKRRSAYTNPDNDPRGPWASVDMTGMIGRATKDRTIIKCRNETLGTPDSRIR